MEIVTARSRSSSKDQGRQRRKASNGHVVAQLLDSPLPTPRRSCCGSAGDTPRSLRRGSPGASPQRTHVPFSWESSPGVPKDACGGGKEREVLPPKPPPGRGDSGTPCHAHAPAYHGNTTDATSSDDDDTFSDALDRISCSDRLAAFSARLSSIDSAGSRRSPSFIMDRFLPAANAIATTSAEKHPKKSPRRGERCSKHEEEAPPTARRETHSLRCAPARDQLKHSPRYAPALQREERATPPRQSKDAAVAQRINSDEQGDQVSPRACGLMLFFPRNVKPVLCWFPRSPGRCWTPRADVGTTPSPPRRSTTLGDVLVKERVPRNGDLSHWYEEKSGSGKEWSSTTGWGMAILGTSKRYCTDARKALSRLARTATDAGGSPRVSRERRGGKPTSSPLRSTSGKMPQLKPPSESWLSHARGSTAVNKTKDDGIL